MSKKNVIPNLERVVLLFILVLFLSSCITQTHLKEQQPMDKQQSISECVQKENSWCFIVSDETWGDSESCMGTKDQCLSGRAGDLKDASICETITSQQDKDDCYQNVAGNSGNAKLCGNINTNEGKSHCIGRVAANKKNIDLCNNATYKDDCYLEFSTWTNDVDASICNLIKDLGKKDSCMFSVNSKH